MSRKRAPEEPRPKKPRLSGRAPKVSATPLFSRTRGNWGMLARIARAIFGNDSEGKVQLMYNWKSRGMPFHYVDLVAPELGLTRGAYLAEAGFKFSTEQEEAEYDIVTQRAGERELLANFRKASPPGQALLRRVARMLAAEDRAALPKIVAELVTDVIAAQEPPKLINNGVQQKPFSVVWDRENKHKHG